ncbi:Bcr/CflA family multidrug efflux MFS transporter [Fluviispira sanaruensis]|uniref:Bcr/CflA family drug resistance efflux transporter n=1 Tax=Fluviispira sanaruensis TaxID=2493639 RepID=A0A4P2VIS7_FLUSA|nr:Bcr/CflA family multidrug efflux MFS transporter [Fluviispira sanaruensis]BBH53063.1 Bcr/CflA family drug resistance efflux transporter [Fluviispira sanaruensis]
MNQTHESQNAILHTDGKRKWLVILLGVLTAFDPLTIDMYLPAFQSIQKDLNTHISYVELSVSTFFIGMALGQLIYGPLSDRFGRKKPLLGGMFLYLFASLGCALSQNIYLFIVCRILQAFGGSASMVISRAVVRDLFDKKHIAIFLSNIALVLGIAPIIAPSIGACLNSIFGWRSIFYTLGIANLICIFIVTFLLPETNTKRHENIKFRLVIRSYKMLLKDKHFIGYLIPDIAVRAGMFAYIAGSPFVFIELFKMTPQQYGLVFGMNGLGILIASQVNKKLLVKWNAETICTKAVKVSFITASLILAFAFNSYLIFPFLISIFIFLSMLNLISPNSIAIALSPYGHQAGTASALYGSLQWSMAFFSSFLVSYFHNGSALPMASAIFLCGVVSLIGYILLIKPQHNLKKTNTS